MEAAVRRRGEGKGRERFNPCSLGGDELCDRDHRSCPWPKKFQLIARSVSHQTWRCDHCRARTCTQAIPCSAVCIYPATLWRPARAPGRYLGYGDSIRKPTRESEHSVGRSYTRLRLSSVGLFYRPT